MHVGLGWFGARLLAPPPRDAGADGDPILMWLPARTPTSVEQPPMRQPSSERPTPRESRRDVRPHAATATSASQPEIASNTPPPTTPASTTDTGLTAIQIDHTTLDPSTPPPRTPWDAPTGKAFASDKPKLPGQGAQRFKMRPPRSIASTVQQIGRMFGGGGPSDCEETRKNIRDLAVLGAEAVAQEVAEERRNCRK
ncbi:hypothetical protein V7787_46630 [Pseudomonas sp. CGJS7]